MENIDDEVPNAMFVDDDIKQVYLTICLLSCYNSLTNQSCLSHSFDHQLENFRVDTVQLKHAATYRFFSCLGGIVVRRNNIQVLLC